jgi:hypothetical protein
VVSIWFGLDYYEGALCRPIGADMLANYDVMVSLLRAPSVAKFKATIEASGRELYWTDYSSMQWLARCEYEERQNKEKSNVGQLSLNF